MKLRPRLLLLTLLPATALFAMPAPCAEPPRASKPLRLELDVAQQTPPARRVRAPRRAPDFVPPPSVARRAMESMLEASDAPPPLASEPGKFKFERRGSAGRDLGRAYRNMTERVSARVWDEPNGKRIKFDVAGKPGVAIEIPIQ